MSVLNRKLVRELIAAKGILTAIMSIIVVAVMSFVTMATLYNNLEQSRIRYYATCRMADVWISVTKLPLSELSQLRDVAGLADLRSRISFPAVVDLEDVERPVSARVISLPGEPAPVINNVVLREGGYFTGRRENEVIVNEKFARAHGLKPGQTIHVLLNNRRQPLQIVGTAISSEFVYSLPPGGLVPDPEAYGVFYIPEEFAEDVYDFQGACNEVLGLLAPEIREDPDALLEEVEAVLEPYGVKNTLARERQPSHWFLMNEITGLEVTAIILPGIFLSIAALVLNVLMLRMAEQQRTIVGTLKALGYSNRQVLVHFLKFGAVVGLLGGVLGGVCGYFAAGGLTGVYQQYFEFPELINRVYPGVIGLGILISVVFAILGILHGALRVVRLAPAEAMRPRPPERGTRVFLERWQWGWRRIGFRWQMVMRGIFRHRLRTVTSVLSTAAGACMLLVTFAMFDATLEIIDFQFDRVLLSDFDVAFKDARDEGAVLELKRAPGVDYAEPVFSFACTLEFGHRSHKGAITGVMPDARLTVPRNVGGEPIGIPESGVLLTRRLAERLGVQTGDVLRVVPVDGDRTPRKARVAAINDSYLGLVAYADRRWLSRLVGESGAVTSVQLEVDPASTREFYRTVKQFPAVESVSSVRAQKDRLMSLLAEQMLVSLGTVIGFAAVIFFGSILNASMISLSERKQQVATFRVFGYTAADTGKIFLRENLCLTMAGTLLGLPLGYWATVKIAELYSNELFRMPIVIEWYSWTATVGLGLLFGLTAHVPVHRTVARLDWVATLNVKE